MASEVSSRHHFSAQESAANQRGQQQQQQQRNRASFLRSLEAGAKSGAPAANFASGAARDTEGRAPPLANQAATAATPGSSSELQEAAEQSNMTLKEAPAQSQEATTSQEEEPGKHHVGPVMGIFFKVWSLVKVTKVRHNQRMRRQISEEPANQFHYIAGEQIQPAIAGGHAHQLHLLEDRHFRRAGSQPAPSSSGASARLSDHFRPLASPAANQVAGHSERANSGGLLAAPGTSSSTSTSGVSSATSSGQLSANQVGVANCSSSCSPVGSTSPSAVKRHVSAYSLRRSAVDAPSSPNGVAPTKQLEQSSRSPTKTPSGKSWASKIKRSATSVNQGDFSSYVARYRSSRRSRTKPTLPSPPDMRRGVSGGQQQSQVERRAAAAMLERRPSETTSDGGYELDRNPDDQLTESRNDYEDDDGSNDIYSTPHDSIQSVPGTAPLLCAESAGPAYGLAVHQAASQAYPIIKSFSTSNFGQLAGRCRESTCPFKPIGEESSDGARRRNDGLAPPPSGSDSPKPDLSAKRLSDSRFFISSSSSEDSNSPNPHHAHHSSSSSSSHAHLQQQQRAEQRQQQQQQQTLAEQQEPACGQEQRAPPYQLEQQQTELALQQGVHLHSPTRGGYSLRPVALRPHSLLLEPLDCSQTRPALTLFTPTAGSAPNKPAVSHHNKQVASVAPLEAAAALLPAQPASFMAPSLARLTNYRKSPSMMEMSNPRATRFSSRYPVSYQQSRVLSGCSPAQNNSFVQQPSQPAPLRLSSFKAPLAPSMETRKHENGNSQTKEADTAKQRLPSSISLFDCKLTSSSRLTSMADLAQLGAGKQLAERQAELESEYKLAQMLLESGSNPNARDGQGYTALMHAVLSDNAQAIKCLLEHGVDLNASNNDDLTALDLLCSRPATEERLTMLKLLIENHAELDRTRESDGTRLLDRLIQQHNHNAPDKLLFIDCLLQSGAKLGSSTWAAASGKHEVQLRLLKKLCQDGYFLYKQSSLEGAVYRFEYALKRIAELEQQLSAAFNGGNRLALGHMIMMSSAAVLFEPQLQSIHWALRQIKYQTYLGLSRCERKRRFFKRALEFAHMAILVDSTSYEGYYSKAHILKDLGETDDSLMAIDQTSRLVEKSIEQLLIELRELQQQEETLIFDNCFNMHDSSHADCIEASRCELSNTLDYLKDAKKYVAYLKDEILNDKLRQNQANFGTDQQIICTDPIAII